MGESRNAFFFLAYLNGVGANKGRVLDGTLPMLVAMIVHMTVMMPVMIQARGCAISLSGIRMARVQRVYRLQMMMMLVNVVQSAVSPSVGVGRRRLARYAGAYVMMIHAGVAGQAAGRAAVMMAAQRRRRQTVVDVDHVSVHGG